MMGIPVDIMTPIFAISRISGWCAHVIEEKFGDAQEKPALYRPQAEYVGHYCGDIGCEYHPLQERA
jgi:citrate synthase